MGFFKGLCQLALLGSAVALPGHYADLSHKAKAASGEALDFDNALKTGAPSPTKNFKFLTKATTRKNTLENQTRRSNLLTFLKAFHVSSLPSVPFSIGEMYSGLLPIKAGDKSRELFFVFQPSTGPPTKDLTIWLNGGPGCSSLEGFFQENGKFVWRAGSKAPIINPYAWTNLTNMLWVEQPVGTGYTIGDPTASSEEEIAQDFVGFLKNFQTTFSISGYKIFVTGESYAGRYVPYISSAILDQKDTTNFNLGGAMMYDPCIGQFDYVQENIPAYPFAVSNNHIFNFDASTLSGFESTHKSCGYDSYISKYLTFPPPGHQPSGQSTSGGCDLFDQISQQAMDSNSCFNIYEVNQTCPTPNDPMTDNDFPASGGGKTNYFDSPAVKAALHADAGTTWAECGEQNVFTGFGGPEGEGDSSADPIQAVLPKVIEATNRVLVAGGDLDMIILSQGTLLSIQNMTWNGALGFQTKPSMPITAGDGGIQHYERGLMWGETFKCGHMGPEYQPAVSYRHLQWLLGMIQTL